MTGEREWGPEGGVRAFRARRYDKKLSKLLYRYRPQIVEVIVVIHVKNRGQVAALSRLRSGTPTCALARVLVKG